MEQVLQAASYPRAWTAGTLETSDWLLTLPAACKTELEKALVKIRQLGKPVETLRTAQFELAECAAFMESSRGKLDQGTGFVCYDRLPVESCADVEEAKALYWLMGSLLDPPQPQYFEGYLIFDLRYTGIHEQDNEQAHRVKTDELLPHSDESLGDIGPKYVGLMCWRQAKIGGQTRLFSFHEAYRRLAMASPALALRLAEPFFWLPERQVADDVVYYHPVVTQGPDGLRFQYSQDYNWRGYRKWGETFDDLSRDALQGLNDHLVEAMFEVTLEPGQFVLFNNDTVAHGRAYHEDWPQIDRKRHLLRLWLGQSGAPYPLPAGLKDRLLARRAA